jgi:1-acyl-sn-glycerol-3-phosphate acyltransferase
MATPIVFPACNATQKITLSLFADWEVAGKEHVPRTGPLIVVANHQSNIDPPILAASLPRRIWFLAKDSIFGNPVADWFLRSYGAFPLNRSRADIRAYRWVLNQLGQNRAVALFPEGTRGSGAMQKANSGVVRLAMKSGAPLLPVGITGTERLGTVFRVFNPTGRVKVNIGRTFSISPIESKPSVAVLESTTDMIMRRVAALLPEEYQGVYLTRPADGAAAQGPR